MYAVIEVGGRQYNVKKNDLIEVEKQDTKGAKDILLDKVLLVAKDKTVEVGRPYVKGAKVEAAVVKNLKGEKTIAYKYRRRKSSHWTKGNRQELTQLKIKDIVFSLS
ncbi:MAG: 50S ribosomal protein L21 [Candidatus Omnitrophota bacterium]|jgi:large subunit ribosomal protein L21